jgi:hypothetical protein
VCRRTLRTRQQEAGLSFPLGLEERPAGWIRVRLGARSPLRGALRASNLAARDCRTRDSKLTDPPNQKAGSRPVRHVRRPGGAPGRMDSRALGRTLAPAGRAARVQSRCARLSSERFEADGPTKSKSRLKAGSSCPSAWRSARQDGLACAWVHARPCGARCARPGSLREPVEHRFEAADPPNKKSRQKPAFFVWRARKDSNLRPPSS